MKPDVHRPKALLLVIAPVFGILTAAQDWAAPFGDDSSKSTIVLWLAFSGLLGFADPRRPWLWAVLVGPWLPLMYLVLQAAKLFTWPAPNNDFTGLILLPVSLVVCAIGAYAGAMVRRISLPVSSPSNGLAGTETR